jgi:hypothetical protein
LWDWPRFIELDDSARCLWLALYTTAEAKRHAPGLWQGGVPAMADASRQHPDAVIHALDSLLDHDMVEFDNRTRVLRLCYLPDAGEFPSNGKVILGWWTRFRSVPDCGVRNAHVTTLRWILDEGARLSGKGISPHHESAWRETFGTVAIPASRHRGVRRLADSDTSTRVQPSLFPSEKPSGNGIAEAAYPQHPQVPVDRSAALHQLNKINIPETVSDTVSDTNRIPDPGSRILDPSEEGGRGGGHESGRPVLTLVPPYHAGHVLKALAQGPWDGSSDRTHLEAVGAMIGAWAAAGVGVADFELLAEYNAHTQRKWSARALLGCDIAHELEVARKTIAWRDLQHKAMLAKLP